MDKTTYRSRQLWPILFYTLFLVVSIVLLYFLQSNAVYTSILAILIGALFTNITQLVTQSRERQLRFEDIQLERERQIIDLKVEKAREHFLYLIVGLIQMIKHLDEVSSSPSGFNEEMKSKMNKEIDNIDHKILSEGRAIIRSLASPQLDNILTEIRTKVPGYFYGELFKVKDAESFELWKNRFIAELEQWLGSAYSELDKIKLKGKL